MNMESLFAYQPRSAVEEYGDKICELADGRVVKGNDVGLKAPAADHNRVSAADYWSGLQPASSGRCTAAAFVAAGSRTITYTVEQGYIASELRTLGRVAAVRSRHCFRRSGRVRQLLGGPVM